jgi:site-specific DNA recombinase
MSLTAADYCRISEDPEGLEVGVSRQREDNSTLAAREGYEIIEHFEDNDIGASTLSKKARPSFNEMMKRAWAGEFDAIIAYSNSRLTRRPMELEDFILLFNHRLKMDRPLRIITMVSGEDNLATADGRMVARFKAAADAGEAERTGERVTRARASKRDKGEPHSAFRPFGWQEDRRTLDPTEAGHVRAAVDMLIEGASLHEVCRDFNDAGLLTTRGNTWTYQTAFSYFHNPRLAGYVGQEGEMYRHSQTGEHVTGQWEPMIDLSTYERLCARLDRNKTGRQVRDASDKALLSGILRCGVCGTKMYAVAARGGKERPDGTRTKRYNAAYRCGQMTSSSGAARRHYQVIDKAKTEEYIEALVLGYLDRKAALETTKAPTVWSGQSELDAKNERVSELLGAFERGELASARVFPIVQRLEDDIAAMKKDRTKWLLTTTGPVPERISPDEWSGFPLWKKRGYMGRLFTSIVVTRSSSGATRYDPERLDPLWTEGH